MAKELEILWQKLMVTEQEGKSVNLGRECTRAANERGKNCLVMKVLSRRGVILDALRKNIRMLWKPNKSIRISVIEEEMFLVEFDDERDKRRVLEMSPWHYEKQLVLLHEFDGDQDPKDIILKWSPFWVQMYNLPLKHRTRETGMAIGASLGEVLEVDVADTGVQWGKCLQVCVKIDVSRVDRKLTNNEIEGSGQRVMETHQTGIPKFKFEPAPKAQEGGHVGLELTKDGEGPVAMTYDMEVGWVAEAALPSPMNLLAWNCRGLGSAPAVRSLTNEVKDTDSVLVFLSETQANQNRIRGIQRKLNFTQGITVPSDGRSEGLAMLWKEGADVSFKSCSNAHIDVVVRVGVGALPWQATGFYGHPDADRDARQMEVFRECLTDCGLIDLGFVG
nr:hypothetical protein CFP56_36671 [Quercus suber]